MCVVRALIASGSSSGVTFRKSQILESEENTHPLTRKDLEDFESPLPHFSAPTLLLLSILLINGGAGSAGSPEPVGTRAGGGGRAGHGFHPRSPGAEPRTRWGRISDLPSAALALSSVTTPFPSPPFLSLSPTPTRYRELSGVSFSIFL